MLAIDNSSSQYLDRPVRVTEQTWPSDTQPVVSIVCITYNHENFIKECLDGFLMQETTFPVEIVVHDDASQDDTPNILKRYAADHPGLFHLILQQENKFSKNIRPTPIAIAAARGRFIAFCDGDDYWTDPTKLESQVRHLEAKPGANLSFHRVRIRAMDGRTLDISILPEFELKAYYPVEEMMRRNFLPTSSVLVRREAVASTPNWFPYISMNDWPRWIIACENSPALAFNKIMGIYRVHDTGLWTSLDRTSKFIADLDFYHILEIFGNPKIRAIAKEEKRRRASLLLINLDDAKSLNTKLLQERQRLSRHFLFGPALRLWRSLINRSFPSFN